MRSFNARLNFFLLAVTLASATSIGALAVVVQGLAFGFVNVSMLTILPACFFGGFAALVISYLIVRNRENLLKRLHVETTISTKLREEIEERARVDLALKASEQSYRRILDNMLDTYYRSDLDGQIVMVSAAVSGLLGYDVSELIGTQVSELYADPSSRGEFRRRLEENGEKVEQFEFAVRRKDGNEILVSSNGQYYRDEDGRIAGIEGTVRDITARRQAEDILRDREERLVEAQRIARIGSWELNLTNDVLTWSDEVYRLLEVDPKSFTASNNAFLEAVHPDDREMVDKAHTASLANRSPYEITHRFRMKDGRIKWVQARYEMDFDGDGKPLRSRGTVQDITESILAERAVRTRDAWLRAILDNAPIEIILKDLDGRILAVGRNVSEILGLESDNLIGRTTAEFLPRHIADMDLDADRKVVATGEPLQQEISEEINGVMHHSLNAKFPLRDDDGNITGICSMTSDITEMKQAEEQLRQAQKMEMIGQLTGGVAHDFNNLLAAIIGNLDLIEEDSIPAEFDRESISTALRAALRGAELTHRLFAFSRQQELDAKTTQINQMLPHFSQLAQRTIGGNITIEMKLAADLWPTMVDSGQLENALLNLAINARDAMPDGGLLVIETANKVLDQDDTARYEDLAPGDYVMIAVSDNGTGMRAEVRERVFEPFFTTKPVGQGSGLGLSMVFGFAKQSGGHVSIYSEVGDGTTVRIYLPREQRAATAESIDDPSHKDRPTGDETIMVVEDDKAVRDYLVIVLRRLGYTVLEAEDGPAALEVMAAASGIDLLLTDVILPRGMSGRDVAIAFRKRYPAAGVLNSSGYTREILNRRGQLEQGVVLMNKPYQTPALAQRVREVLDDHV
ncbi:MAG: PAS domain S-box protein [Proteobacteria bacterium]|nr:PAS domain S-box protein [Pseudomonadota bacterium]